MIHMGSQGREAQGWTIVWGVIPQKINIGVPADVLEGIFSSLEQEVKGRRGWAWLMWDIGVIPWWCPRPQHELERASSHASWGTVSPGNTQELHDVSRKLLRAWSTTRFNSASRTL